MTFSIHHFSKISKKLVTIIELLINSGKSYVKLQHVMFANALCNHQLLASTHTVVKIYWKCTDQVAQLCSEVIEKLVWLNLMFTVIGEIP